MEEVGFGRIGCELEICWEGLRWGELGWGGLRWCLEFGLRVWVGVVVGGGLVCLGLCVWDLGFVVVD